MNNLLSIDYDECNNSTYMIITIENLTNNEKLKIKSEINNEKYHIEIDKKIIKLKLRFI